MNANLFAHLEASVTNASKVAITQPHGKDFTYGEFFQLTGKLANAIVAKGVKPGDRVAVQVEKTVVGLALYLATLRAGAVFLPLNTAYTSSEVEYFVTDAEPRLIVCDPSYFAAVEKIADKVGAAVETLSTQGDGSLAAALPAADCSFETVERHPNDLAAILYTSGTTGRSKGAMLTHQNLVSNAVTLMEEWRFTSSDILIHALPIYHTHGLFVATNVALFSGARIVFLAKFDVDEILTQMAGATVMMGVPTFYTRLLKSPRLGEVSLGMRLFVSGSAPLLTETHVEWSRVTGHSILERYGMTETNMNTSNPYDGDRVAGTVGFPLPGVSVRITDPESGASLGVNDVGMIEVKGPNVFSGYWRMPEKTKAEFRPDGFFVTGDIGKVDDRGYVHIIGRAKDLVITGGFNVYPKEIEEEIDAIDGVVESAVVGIPHQDFGEGVTAFVVRADGSTLDEGGVVRAVRDRLAKFKLPKKVIFVTALPRNTMGKVQKNLLRERYGDIYQEAEAPLHSAAAAKP
ncbi:malonyl-CoA synthase [Sinorhizobium meliloti]|uniref:malonate--CoA ligase n=1 Tax=Rhizobium meliloti TaxID=382 RepID=UPI003D64B6D4